MIIKNSANPLAGFAIGQIDHSIKLYSSVLRDHATPSLVQNHQWLLRLRQRALSKLDAAAEAAAAAATGTTSNSRGAPTAEDEDIDVELLGWRTRLIERARGGRGHRATTIQRPSGSAPTSAPGSGSIPTVATLPPVLMPPPATMGAAPSLDQVLQQHFAEAPVGQQRGGMGDTTTDLLVSFSCCESKR